MTPRRNGLYFSDVSRLLQSEGYKDLKDHTILKTIEDLLDQGSLVQTGEEDHYTISEFMFLNEHEVVENKVLTLPNTKH